MSTSNSNSNMVADASTFKKVPAVKAEWFTEFKLYFETKADSLGILETLRGNGPVIKSPEEIQQTLDQINGIKNKLTTRGFLEDQNDKAKRKYAKAWDFIYEITKGTAVETVIKPFMVNKDAEQAWTAIVTHYESDFGLSQRLHLQEQLDSLQIPDTKDLKLDWLGLLNNLNRICQSLESLPPAHRLQVDEITKKGKLHKALAQCSRFNKVLDDSFLNKDTLQEFTEAVGKHIDFLKETQVYRGNSSDDVKKANIKGEVPTASALLTGDINLDNVEDDALNAMKVHVNKNRNKVVREIKKRQKQIDEGDAHAHHRGKKGKHVTFDLPPTWRGGGRRDAPYRGGRNNYRGGRGGGRQYGNWNRYNRNGGQAGDGNNANDNNTTESQSSSNYRDGYYRGGRGGYRGSRGYGRGNRDGGRGRGGYNNNYGNNYQQYAYVAQQPPVQPPTTPPAPQPTNYYAVPMQQLQAPPMPVNAMYAAPMAPFVRPPGRN